jgi:hypothetical protein
MPEKKLLLEGPSVSLPAALAFELQEWLFSGMG